MSTEQWFTIIQLVVSLVLGGIGVQLIRTRPILKKIAVERESNLLEERAEEMKQMRQRLSLIEAELRFERHKNNNLEACLQSLLMLLKQDPSKADEAAQLVMDLRAKQVADEVREKAAIMGRLAHLHGDHSEKEPVDAEGA